jgi:hypothetical protein
MTIVISEFWMWIAVAAMAVSCVLSCIGIYLTRKRMEIIKLNHVLKSVLIKQVFDATTAMAAATEAMNDETSAGWWRFKDVQHVDIKSKLIANSFADGKETMQFKNGVTLVRKSGGIKTRMDS